MPELIKSATRIPVPGGKLIDEYIGNVNSADAAISIAHMRSPAGWAEPGQRPDFDEYTFVTGGTMHVEHEDGAFNAGRGAGNHCETRRVDPLQHAAGRGICCDLHSGVHA